MSRSRWNTIANAIPMALPKHSQLSRESILGKISDIYTYFMDRVAENQDLVRPGFPGRSWPDSHPLSDGLCFAIHACLGGSWPPTREDLSSRPAWFG